MERGEKFTRTFGKFEKAFSKLREIVESPHLFSFLAQELIIEIITKRFEYTFESLWKSLKEYFRQEGIECTTPLACFKEAFKSGVIDERDEEVFLEMIDKRNQIVHVYDFEEAGKIFEFIKSERVISSVRHVYEKLKGH